MFLNGQCTDNGDHSTYLVGRRQTKAGSNIQDLLHNNSARSIQIFKSQLFRAFLNFPTLWPNYNTNQLNHKRRRVKYA